MFAPQAVDPGGPPRVGRVPAVDLISKPAVDVLEQAKLARMSWVNGSLTSTRDVRSGLIQTPDQGRRSPSSAFNRRRSRGRRAVPRPTGVRRRRGHSRVGYWRRAFVSWFGHLRVQAKVMTA